MRLPIPATYLLLFPMTVAVGWFGTRAAFHIRRTKGSRGDERFMLALCCSPLVIWLFSLLLSFFGSEP
jgi:hypothetical protein